VIAMGVENKKEHVRAEREVSRQYNSSMYQEKIILSEANKKKKRLCVRNRYWQPLEPQPQPQNVAHEYRASLSLKISPMSSMAWIFKV
jgi:hypothetical protein